MIRIISCVNVHLLFNIITLQYYYIVDICYEEYLRVHVLTYPVEFLPVYTLQCMSNVYVSVVCIYVDKSKHV